MASQVTNYKCPACGGPLHFVGASGKLECDYCGSAYEVADIEAAMAAQNAQAAAAAPSGGSGWGEDAQGLKSYTCPSCGAELICDANTAATCCPYCGNQTVVPGQFSGSLAPEFVIPFKTDKEQAKSALRAHYKGKVLLPKSFVSGNHIEDIQGVYVPFWMFDCRAEGEMAFDAAQSETHRRGNEEVTTTRYYDVRRAGSLDFDKVPVDASSRMPDGHMDSIEPFHYSDLKPFSMAYMPGFLADKYDVEPADCAKRMEERCEKTLADQLRGTVTGYSQVSERGRDISVETKGVHYAMLPVWMLSTKWRDKSFLFAMNGQSGRLVGDLPMDKGKFWGIFAAISVVLIALMQVINLFLLQNPMEGLVMIAVTILLPILIGLLVVLILKGQLKSVRPQQAARYVTGDGLNLTRREDIYIRTATSVRVIQSSQKN